MATSKKKSSSKLKGKTTTKTNKKTKRKAPNPQKTSSKEMEQFLEDEMSSKGKKRGKTFYLIFALVFYAGAFFYINNILYDNNDLLQSALFAFAALFVAFVLIQFNIHMIIINFFRLPFLYLYQETKLEIKKDDSIRKNSTAKKGVISKKFAEYKALFTLLLYILIIGILAYSQIYNGIMDGDKVLLIITQTSFTLLIFLLIVCSWQYLFHILPSILNKSIDAKNGFVLTLSAAVMVIYIVLNIFSIEYLDEMMIFILIIGFIALVGVNLNMIVGEINIFQNLREHRSKTVTRAVFLIFFSFHIYVVLYASAVAYSIYEWDEESYNFAYPQIEMIVHSDVYDDVGNEINTVYDSIGTPITTVYDEDGNMITDFYDEDGDVITSVYDSNGNQYFDFYNETGGVIQGVYDEDEFYYMNIFYHDGGLAYQVSEEIHETYSTFLYYTVVTTSTLGYGDISPSLGHSIAMAWGGFLSFYGITFYALSIGFVSNIAIEGVTSSRKE